MLKGPLSMDVFRVKDANRPIPRHFFKGHRRLFPTALNAMPTFPPVSFELYANQWVVIERRSGA